MQVRTADQTLANREKLLRLQEVWDRLLDEVLQHGVHGTASVELILSNGTIQRITRRVERFER